ncbi:MAG: PQQ-binding-like beta-propeller repeat protein [Pseudomonadota bacterium]
MDAIRLHGRRRRARLQGKARAPIALAAAALLLSACDTFMGDPEAPPLPGERISVLKLSSALTVDPDLAQQKVVLPKPVANADWPQAGGYSSHAMYHVALGDNLKTAWTAKIGKSADDSRLLLAEPVSANGRVFTLDAGATVSAFDLSNGARVWQLDLTPDDEDDDLFGGGLATDGKLLYVTTGFEEVIALDVTNGATVWSTNLQAPVRAAPTVSDGRVFVLTVDNQLIALAADDGRRLWSHAGVAESASLLGGAAPAVVGPDVIAPFSTGELLALRAETGRVLWSESLAGGQRSESLSQLADIRGRPAIDRDLVVAVSHSGVTAAIDLANGRRVWTQDFGGSQSPWVAGDYIYVLTRYGDVVCLTRDQGRIRWVQSLPRFEDEADKKDPIYWSGPVLAGDRLIVTGSNGEAYSISPYTGDLLGKLALPGRSHLPPIVANGTLLLVTDDAELIALR